ncbi:MAG: germination protein, Ger(x)C family [Firmicutes bacterium]|nr:germination protein, Ger(x)C family [Bacillota bacterium]
MYLRLAAVFLLGISVMVCGGCNGAREPDELAYSVAVGIDKSAKKGMIDITYVGALPVVVGEGGGGDKPKMTTEVTYTVPSLAEARNLLNSVTYFVPTLTHVKILVIGEELAKQGIGDIIGPLTRFREYRGTNYVVVAKGTAKDFFKNNKPGIPGTASRYFESMMESSVETSYFLKTTLHEFYQRLKDTDGTSYATMVDVNPQTMEDKPAKSKTPGEKMEEYYAGDVPRAGSNPVEFSGAAMFRGDKMVAMLTNAETRSLAMLTGKYKRSYITIEDPLAPKHGININLRQGEKNEYITQIVDGKPVVQVTVLLEGEITSLPSGINYEQPEYKELLEESISQIMQQEITQLVIRTQEKGADIVGFGYQFRSKFKTWQDWKEYAWQEKFPQADIRVVVKCKIRRTALMWRTTPKQ